MGTFGQVLTVDLLEAKLQQLPDAIDPYEDYIRANYLGVRTADCIGLIKGYSWYDPESGNINYGSNGMPDVSADQIYAQAAEKGSMATMPEIPGILVHAPGHIGIYIGNGYAIEAMGTRYGVVKTAVASRNWTGWCKNPYINYIEETEEVLSFKAKRRDVYPPFSLYLCLVFTAPTVRKSFSALRTVDSDSFRSLEIVGIDGQQMPSLLARSAR